MKKPGPRISISSSKTDVPAPETPVIALSQYRAQISRGRRQRRADVLFSAPDPQQAIAALPGDEFFYVLQEIGFPEAMEVLLYATPSQVQTVFDFAVWDRDLLSRDRVEQWLEPLVSAPFETVGAWFRGLDVELVALILRQRATVYDLSHGEPPDVDEGEFLTTPDNLFALHITGTEDEMRATSRLIDSLYRYDRSWIRRLLVGTVGELDAELEETAYRWRSGRMEDLGFGDYYQALEVYREIDPAKVVVASSAAVGSPIAAQLRVGPTLDEDDTDEQRFLRMPAMLVEHLTHDAPFAKAIGGVTNGKELTQIHEAMVLLCNRVLSADRVIPGDEAAVPKVLTGVSRTLDLAVEFLARGSDDRAVAAVRSVPVLRLFQLGTTLVGKVRKLAQALQHAGPLSQANPALDLFEAEDAEIIHTLGLLRPQFPRRLDSPPAAGDRPFGSLSDLALATAALERVAAAASLLGALGVRAEHLAPEALSVAGIIDAQALDTGSMARTLLVQHVLGVLPAGLRPLTPEQLETFRGLVGQKKASRAGSAVSQKAAAVLAALVPGHALPIAAAAVAARWVASLTPLGTVLTAGDTPLPAGAGARPRQAGRTGKRKSP